QAVARALPSIRRRGWHVRKARTPERLFGRSERALHAKFLFGANSRENSDSCNSAWIYFGSGNLTTPGFTQKMSESGGNLEAGIVFAPQELLWLSEDRGEQYRVVTNLLPMQWEEEFDVSGNNLCAGSDMPERKESFVAAPVAYLKWAAVKGVDSGGWLIVPDQE